MLCSLQTAQLPNLLENSKKNWFSTNSFYCFKGKEAIQTNLAQSEKVISLRLYNWLGHSWQEQPLSGVCGNCGGNLVQSFVLIQP